jgi:hypothetical protein
LSFTDIFCLFWLITSKEGKLNEKLWNPNKNLARCNVEINIQVW